MRVLVVIINYKTAALTIDCLRSLEADHSAMPGMRVAVVDCDSRDDSVSALCNAVSASRWAQWVGVLPLERNAGFAGGNNAAIRMALQSADPPEYVMLLNPDTIAAPGAVEALVRFLDEHKEIGLAGSRLEGTDGSVQVSAFRFPGLLSEFESTIRLGLVSRLLSRWRVAPPPPDHAEQCDWLSGAALLVRRTVLEEVGLLDEAYFMYYEDIDFCRAARNNGWTCWYVPESRVVHLVGQSSGIENARKPRPPYWFDARRRYFVKNHGRAYALACDAAWILGHSLWRARRWILRKPDTDPPGLLRDFIRNNAFGRGKEVEQRPELPPPRPSANDGLPPNVLLFSRDRRQR